MRLSLLATATLGFVLFATAASAAVVPTRVPKMPTPSAASMQSCDPSFGSLMDVHKMDVMAVTFDNTIVIRPVCAESHLDGNAATLTGVIRRNEALSAALGAENYRSDDVIGIQFGDDGVVLLFVME
jgi:hypothetical protein